ncbi:MAG: family 1 extracellular solute-binding protein [Paenibacillaceae bacterium]|jgi:multiple sugar transport system substrate-binding protein|nr:family 1 extracellular solute-binding protein [Paenibacillaceae bacterium]
MMRKRILAGWLIGVAIIVTACGGPAGQNGESAATGGKDAAAPAFSTEPVTLQVFQQGASLSDGEFNNLMVEPIKKKYPNITLELVRNAKGATPPELVAAGTFPDIVFSSGINFYSYQDLAIPQDLNELIKKYKFDVNIFQPAVVESIRSFGDKGQFYALPFSMNFSAIYYNRDIFDQTAIPYPKDGMTFAQLVDVAKNISAKGGDKYQAFDITGLDRMSFNLPRVDLKTKKATLTGSDWVKVFQLVKEIKEIPNNAEGNRNKFFKDKNVALIMDYGAGFLGMAEETFNDGTSPNWDVISYPINQTPGQSAGGETQIHSLMISTMSKHKDAAFQVISFLAGSEAQMLSARQGRMPALVDKKVQDVFAADLKSAKGKNLQTVFKQKYAPNTHPTRYDRDLAKPLQDAEKAVLTEGADINTALRTAEEQSNQIIAEMDAAAGK